MQIIKNLSAVLEGAGSSLDKVLKVNVFLTSVDTFDEMNEGYKQLFHDNLPVMPRDFLSHKVTNRYHRPAHAFV